MTTALPSKTLRLTWWHLGLWLGLAVVAGGISLQACLRYNDAAGRAKPPAHIAAIAVAVLTGPLVGPVANPHHSNHFKLPPTLIAVTLALLGVQLLALAPFRSGKRSVSTALFVAALVSLGFYLS